MQVRTANPQVGRYVVLLKNGKLKSSTLVWIYA